MTTKLFSPHCFWVYRCFILIWEAWGWEGLDIFTAAFTRCEGLRSIMLIFNTHIYVVFLVFFLICIIGVFLAFFPPIYSDDSSLILKEKCENHHRRIFSLHLIYLIRRAIVYWFWWWEHQKCLKWWLGIPYETEHSGLAFLDLHIN